MTTLQNDILEIYNSLVVFSDNTVKTNFPTPILVRYEIESRLLVFEQLGNSVRIGLPVYYCLGLEDIKKPTYLLPEDYDYLMYTLQSLISSGELIKPRTIISPENYGFSIYAVNLKELFKGPRMIGNIKFISGKSWIFKLFTKLKYKL